MEQFALSSASYNIAVIIIDCICTRSYFERVLYLLDVTSQWFIDDWLIDAESHWI